MVAKLEGNGVGDIYYAGRKVMGSQPRFIRQERLDKNLPPICGPWRILCVDDDLASLRLRRAILERAGYQVIDIDRPRAALEQDLSVIDLIILDYDMPEMNGRDLFLRLRTARVICPIILLSGGLEGLPPEVRVLFSTCIAKGMPVEEILTIVAAYLKQAMTRDAP